MKARSAVLVGVFGCGSVANSPPDASGIDATADSQPARCNPTRPFDTPVALPILNIASDFSPSLSADELTIYFASTRGGGPGGFDIYIATRATASAAFGSPSLLNGVNSADKESRPVLTADGLTLYAEVQRGTNPYHIERATRATTSVSFGALSPVAELNSTSSEAAPFVLPNHRAVYFISRRGGNPDIYRAEASGGTFSTPVLVTGTDLQGNDLKDYPILSGDELTICFGSTRSGGLGGFDIWMATRASVAQGFSAPVPVTELNSAATELPGWLSPDGCVLYFARDLGGQYDLFVARRGM